jgi:hypothetical protein
MLLAVEKKKNAVEKKNENVRATAGEENRWSQFFLTRGLWQKQRAS